MLFELFTSDNEPVRSPTTILRRLILWSLLCWVSAGPSLYLAGSATGQLAFNRWAMASAIILFSLLYTALTSTDAFDRFHRIRGMRRTLYIGYWTRLALSIAFPISFVMDVITGLVSIRLAAIAGASGTGFLTTFIITCLHGTLMNVLIAAYMALLFPIVRAMSKDKLRPGFEVLIPEAQVLPPSADAAAAASPDRPAAT